MEVLTALNLAVENFLLKNTVNEMSEITKILQVVQISYKELIYIERKKSDWHNNINANIAELEKLLCYLKNPLKMRKR